MFLGADFFIRYKRHAAYWESVMMTRRALAMVIAALSVSSSSKVEIQLFLAFLSDSLALALHLYVQPYKDEYLNMLDALGLVSILASIIIGALYQSKTVSTGSSNVVSFIFIMSLMSTAILFMWFVVCEVVVA